MKIYSFLFSFVFLISHIVSAQGRLYSVETGDFEEVRIQNSVNVIYLETSDSIGIATFTADDETSQALVFENKKGKLTISLQPRTFNREHPIPTVTIRSKSIKVATNEGDSLLIINYKYPKESFRVKQIGNGLMSVRNFHGKEIKAVQSFGAGRITINGTCDKAILDNTGQGIIQAGGLKAVEAVCYIMGTGNIDCNVTDDLSVKGLGSGTVFYSGSPKNIRNRGLGLKVIECNDCNSIIQQ